MKTYLRGHVVSRDDVEEAYLLWSRSRSGRKNGWAVVKFHGSPDALVDGIYEEIRDRRLEFGAIRYFERWDEGSQKWRVLGKQTVKQQVADYLAVMLLQPLYDAKVGYWQTASIPGRGQVFAMRAIRSWVNDEPTSYWVKLDVRKCYPSHEHEVVRRLYRRHVGSADVLYLVDALLDTYGERGLNIGSYFSQYTANYTLSYAYHHVEGLAKERRGRRRRLVDHQLWYMDDLLLMSRDKRDLKVAARSVEGYLADELHLRAKPWKVCRVADDPLPMVGYVMEPGRVRVRDATFLKARRAYRRFERHPTLDGARRVVSYHGLLKWADTRTWMREHEAARTFERAKALISRHDKVNRR